MPSDSSRSHTQPTSSLMWSSGDQLLYFTMARLLVPTAVMPDERWQPRGTLHSTCPRRRHSRVAPCECDTPQGSDDDDTCWLITLWYTLQWKIPHWKSGFTFKAWPCLASSLIYQRVFLSVRVVTWKIYALITCNNKITRRFLDTAHGGGWWIERIHGGLQVVSDHPPVPEKQPLHICPCL